MSGNGKSGLFGNAERVAVERGLAEFRSGRPVIMTAAGEVVVVLPVDGMTGEQLASFGLLCAPAKPYLLVTARRARALGIEAAGPVGLAIGELDTTSDIFSFAADTQVTRHFDVVPAGQDAGGRDRACQARPAAPGLADCRRPAPAVAACDPPLVTRRGRARSRAFARQRSTPSRSPPKRAFRSTAGPRPAS